MVQFIPLPEEPGTFECPNYTSGTCCHDFHFDMRVVLPEANGRRLCMTDDGDSAQVTHNKDWVNCTECIAIMRS